MVNAEPGRELVLQKNNMYATPALNDKLYLHFKVYIAPSFVIAQPFLPSRPVNTIHERQKWNKV